MQMPQCVALNRHFLPMTENSVEWARFPWNGGSRELPV